MISKPIALSMTLPAFVSGDIFAEGSRQNAEIIIPDRARPYYEDSGYAPAIRIGDTIYVSGVIVSLRGDGSYEERYARGYREALEWIGMALASPDGMTEIKVVAHKE